MAAADLAVIIPTRDRGALLQATLDRLARITFSHLRVEVIVVDNGSRDPVSAVGASRLGNGWPIRVIRSDENLGAAGRNLGCSQTEARWSLMLDDDSVLPADGAASFEALLGAVDDQHDLFAVGGRILLPDGQHEAGGVPEVFVGCGALVRTDVFTKLGGYDGTFEYYAEEYDLCARAIAAGYRVVHDGRLRVLHMKAAANRDMDRILRLLVRNNGWVTMRYAPGPLIDDEMARVVERYGQIAVKERAEAGFEAGVDELRATLDHQPRTPLTPEQYERFQGITAVRAWLGCEVSRRGVKQAQIVAEGKGADIVARVLEEQGVQLSDRDDTCACAVLGTISPGPMEDAASACDGQYEVVLRGWKGFL